MSEKMRRPPLWDPGVTGDLPHPGEAEDLWVWARSFVTALPRGAEAPDIPGDTAPDGPVVWLVTYRIGLEESGALSGLVLAGLLARRGRRVLLVDADEAEMVLTRRCGREFKPGWLDMVRYGSSLEAAAVPVDWEGGPGYFLGLGSYCPPEVTADELAAWLPRMAGDVDDVVVVVGPAATAWRIAGARTLYAWDRRCDKPAVLDVALDHLAARDLPCDLILAWGAAPAPVPEPAPTAETEPAPSPEPAAAGEIPVERDVRDRGHSSGIFRALAVTGLVVVVMLAVFIWKFTDLGRMAEPEFDEPAAVGSPQASPPTVTDTIARAGTDSLTGAGTDSIAPAGTLDAVAAATTLAAGRSRDESAGPDSLAGAAVRTAPGSSAPPPSGVVEPEPAAPDPEALWRRFEPAFSKTVGADGWCLHVFSLRDSTAAKREIRMIERRDVWAVGAPVVRRDSTRWFRIYVGSFPSRAAADSALPALKWKLKTDWAAPAVLPASAWD